MGSDFSVDMLSVASRNILVIHVVLNLGLEEVREEEHSWVSASSEVGFISGVSIVSFFSAHRNPLLRSYESIIEDVVGVDSKESSVGVISDTTTIVTHGNQIFEGLPIDIVLSFEGWINRLSILKFTHVLGK